MTKKNRNIWPVIAGTAAIIAIALSLFFFLYTERAKKRNIEVTLISSTNLIKDDIADTPAKLELFYDGIKIQNYFILQFKIENIGRQPIRPEDFTLPIQIHFKNAKKIISSDKLSSDPSDLPVTAAVSSSFMTISPLLLNPTDWFVLKVDIIPSTISIPEVGHISGRIAGIKQIQYNPALESSVKPHSNLQESLYILMRMIIVFSGIIIFIAFVKRRWIRLSQK